MHNPKLDAALDAARRGFRVFPLGRDSKIPWARGWQDAATTDPGQIREWWTENPYRNIGVATGGGLVVVDVDVKGDKPGAASLAMLDMIGLPETLRVRTPTGGTHVYLKTDGRHSGAVGNIRDFPGLDTRGDGNLVVWPGSTIGRYTYRIEHDSEAARCPRWLLETIETRAGARTARVDDAMLEADLPENVERARHWLVNSAQQAIEGAGGDQATYSVAAELRAKGVSEGMAFELMADHWNETKASPPWQPDDLLAKVAHAYAYGQGAFGGKTAQGELGPLDIEIGEPPAAGVPTTDEFETGNPATDPSAFPFTIGTEAAAANPPPRQWLYGHMLVRKYVGILASPGGVGKTAWTTTAALAMASGETLLHERPHRPLNVWLYNLEDDIVEMQRRVQAAARHYEATPETLERIALTSGRDRPLRLVAQKDGKTTATPDAKALTAALAANMIDVLILDPLVNAHSIPENDQEATAKLMSVLARIADRADCAILLVHHTRKGFVAGDADTIRGGSPLVANSRGAWTLAAMSQDEAKTYGVPDDQRKRYVRLDDAKANMTVGSATGRWMHLQSLALGNGDVDYPAGDSVQVAVQWSPPKALDGLEQGDVRAMLEALREGPGDGEQYTLRSTGGTKRWAGTVLVDTFGRTAEQAKAFLREAVRRRWIVEEEYLSPKTRKTVKGIAIALANVDENDIAELE